jgi:hypothetical protein
MAKVPARCPRFRRPGVLVLAALAAACIRLTPTPVERPAAALERMIFCPAVTPKDGWAEPAAEKSIYVKSEGGSVYSFLEFRDLRGAHALIWKWFGPSRSLYRATDPVPIGADGKAYDSYIAWDRIFISEEKAAGEWTTAVFLDGTLLAAKTFEIR